MAYVRARSNGTFELRVVHQLLPKPYYSTHDDEASARDYAKRIVAMLDTGELPPELRAAPEDPRTPISRVFRDYLNQAAISTSDRPMVTNLQETLKVNLEGVTVKWVDLWVKSLKAEKLAPGTIRKKVECLARVIDWHNRAKYDGGVLPSNPLRTLPKGYSTYGEAEDTKVNDVARDRRLHPGEMAKIEAAILGVKREDRQRGLAIPHQAAFLLLFRLIVSTGLRLREAYTLACAAVEFDLKTIHVAKSKTGTKRDVPMTREVYGWLVEHKPSGPLFFPFWNGEDEDLKPTTERLSAQFGRVFAYSGCEDLTEHDLRHEAVCRWVTLRARDGQWKFRTEEVRKITGHKTQTQFDRYLSLRGSEFANRLWDVE